MKNFARNLVFAAAAFGLGISTLPTFAGIGSGLPRPRPDNTLVAKGIGNGIPRPDNTLSAKGIIGGLPRPTSPSLAKGIIGGLPRPSGTLV
jgi:hypothetical protein